MKEVIVVIRCIIIEENYQTDEFKEFLKYISSGGMENDMQDGNFFEKIKISYQVTDLHTQSKI